MPIDNLKRDFNSEHEKKYELFQDDAAKDLGLYRIRALRDFGHVKKGDVGGFVSSEQNLSHEGNCWIGSSAKVTGTSRVCDDAFVGGFLTLHNDIEAIGGNQRIVQLGRPHGRRI